MYKSPYDLKREAQRRIDGAKRRQKKVDATPQGQARLALSAEFSAKWRREREALDACHKIRKETGALRVLVTGATTFCEVTEGKPHDQLMAERQALGLALKWINPTAIIAGGNRGAERWCRIWADKYAVDVIEPTGAFPDALCAFPSDTWSSDLTARWEAKGVPVYRAELKLSPPAEQ